MARGRPFKPVDEHKLDLLASLGLTTAEIAAVLEVSPDTLEEKYADVMAEGKLKCKASVRRKQFELAMAGNPTMLIWLGKQILGQKEQMRGEWCGPGGGPIPVSLEIDMLYLPKGEDEVQ